MQACVRHAAGMSRWMQRKRCCSGAFGRRSSLRQLQTSSKRLWPIQATFHGYQGAETGIVSKCRQVGEEVEAADVIAEVQIGSSRILGVQSAYKGKIVKVLRGTGEVVRVGDALAEIDVPIQEYPRGWWRILQAYKGGSG
eukprot:TRINITY_DN93916_c0_g1_i1.p1 TRINITY_DN93916_c0_g1~~TRINITY_DN93916_c0_g1_i1.p1  ORF type:complete len:140 (+),score=22.36 TRINITY_DN93916_c0_g1_i1:99-518(+)